MLKHVLCANIGVKLDTRDPNIFGQLRKVAWQLIQLHEIFSVILYGEPMVPRTGYRQRSDGVHDRGNLATRQVQSRMLAAIRLILHRGEFLHVAREQVDHLQHSLRRMRGGICIARIRLASACPLSNCLPLSVTANAAWTVRFDCAFVFSSADFTSERHFAIAF